VSPPGLSGHARGDVFRVSFEGNSFQQGAVAVFALYAAFILPVERFEVDGAEAEGVVAVGERCRQHDREQSHQKFHISSSMKNCYHLTSMEVYKKSNISMPGGSDWSIFL